MQRSDRWPEDFDPDFISRPTSRRNSASSRRNSLKKEEKPLSRSPHASSSHSTPKKVVKGRPEQFDFLVTGKPLLRKSDRANSMPGSYHRRPSDVTKPKVRSAEARRLSHVRDDTRDQVEDMSLDLSQVSDFEDINSKYGRHQRPPLAASTPKPKLTPKARNASVNVHNINKVERLRDDGIKSRDSTFSYSRDSLYRTSSISPYNRGGISTELDYSSVSPEYSGQSSADLSPRLLRSQDINVDSCCVSTCQDCSASAGGRGEWARFWQHYNHPPVSSYYDQCPTPYRTDTIDLNDLDLSTDVTQKRSPENVHNLNNIIRNEGLHLTPRETQNIIKCAHILGNVLTKAIERRSKEKDEDITKIEETKPEIPIDPEIEMKKKTLSLNLTETAIPLEIKVEKTSETVTTQTDISLPNTKSAPRIFENILRQLSRTTLEEKKEIKDGDKKDALVEESKEDGDKIDENHKLIGENEGIGKANGIDEIVEAFEQTQQNPDV